MLKRIFSAIVACAAAICFSVNCFADDSSQSASRVQTAVPDKIAFLGDSIAAGYGLNGYKRGGESPEDSYAYILGEKYKGELSGITQGQMVNLAVSGDTTSQLVSHLESGNMDEKLKDSKAVVISIGGNDVMGPLLAFFYVGLGVRSADDFKKLDPTVFEQEKTLKKMEPVLKTISASISAFPAKMERIVKSLKSKLDAVIIVQTVYNPLDSNPSYAAISKIVGEKLGDLNKAISEGSKNGESYLVCDVAAAFAGKSSELTNIEKFDIHPSAAGHKVIAQEVDKVVRTKEYYSHSAPESSEIRPEASSSESAVESSSAVDSSAADVQSSLPEESGSDDTSSAAESSSSQSDDSSKAEKKTIDKGTIYWTLGLFFGGFILVFAVVMIVFKKRSK